METTEAAATDIMPRGSLLPEVVAAARRFPLSVVASAALTIYLVFDLNMRLGISQDSRGRVIAAFAAAFFLAGALDLVGEARGWSAAVRLASGLAASLVAALLCWQWRSAGLQPAMLVGGSMLTVSLAAAAWREAGSGGFWRFNHVTWTGAALAILAAILLGVGLSSIAATLDYLFGIKPTHDIYEKIWYLASVFVAPVFALTMMPRAIPPESGAGAALTFIERAIERLVRYLLVPLIFVYAAILHVYAARIGLLRELPSGRIGWMVASFGAVVIATVLLAYPTRDANGRLIRLFARWWPALLVVPLVLVFIAITQRIRQYGVTVDRYFVVVIGLWLGALVLAYGWHPERRHLAWIPGLAAAALLVSSFGPWGAVETSVRSQTRIIMDTLASTGMLKDGRVVAVPEKPMPIAVAAKIKGALSWLSSADRLDGLRPLFEGHPAQPFAAATSYEVSRRIGTALALPEYVSSTTGVLHFSFSPRVSGGVLVEGGRYLLGPVPVNQAAGGGRTIPPVRYEVAPGRTLEFTLSGAVLTVAEAGRASLTFDLAAHVSIKDYADAVRSGRSPPQPVRPVVVLRSSGDIDGEIIVDNLNGTLDDKGLTVTYLVLHLLIAR